MWYRHCRRKNFLRKRKLKSKIKIKVFLNILLNSFRRSLVNNIIIAKTCEKDKCWAKIIENNKRIAWKGNTKGRESGIKPRSTWGKFWNFE